jgi:predicted type IV restriction endonuclease
MPIRKVEKEIRRVQQELTDYPKSDYRYNEATTRNVVINPMLEALGWDLRNLDQCGYEIDPKGELWGKKPADYVLGAPSGRTVIVIEAKQMYNQLTTEREEEQLAGYAEGLLTGVAVLTNGTDWYIYNLGKQGSFSDKLVGEVNLLKCNIPEAARTLHMWLDVGKWW